MTNTQQRQDLNEIVVAHIKNYLKVAVQEFEEELQQNYNEIFKDEELKERILDLINRKVGGIII